jgi:sulfite exporter TauE/SafE
MGLDIRLPIGGLFTVLGAILAGYGLLGNRAVYARSLGYNVNLIWGVVLLVFGLLFLYMGRKGTSSVRLAAQSPEGRAVEEMEKRTGKESPQP